MTLTTQVFQQLVPFHILWDGAGRITSISGAVQKLWSLPEGLHAPLELVRPFPAALETRWFPHLTGMVLTVRYPGAATRELRGEVIELDDGGWLLACLPPLTRVSDLEAAGLRLSDLPLHSGLGDALIATEAAHVSLAESLATRAHLERTNARLEAMNDAFGRFVPRQFLNALGLHGPVDASLGARASASTTIMFADLRNFTSISEYLPAAEIFGFINRYLAHVAPRIRANEGFVVHYLGDGILALFHGPPDGAVRAAIEMQQELREAATSGALAGALPPGTELRLGIGLHFGHIEMGIVGESERWDSSIISDAVNTASRVEGLTKVFGVDILVTRAVMEQLHDPAEFEFRRLGYADVKGRVQRVDVYEVLNSLPESMRAARLETRAAFEQAVAAMERGEPAEAIFAACAEQHPDDVAAHAYAQRLAGQT